MTNSSPLSQGCVCGSQMLSCAKSLSGWAIRWTSQWRRVLQISWWWGTEELTPDSPRFQKWVPDPFTWQLIMLLVMSVSTWGSRYLTSAALNETMECFFGWSGRGKTRYVGQWLDGKRHGSAGSRWCRAILRDSRWWDVAAVGKHIFC